MIELVGVEIIRLGDADLELAPRLSDGQAARFWDAIGAAREAALAHASSLTLGVERTAWLRESGQLVGLQAGIGQVVLGRVDPVAGH